MKNKILILCWLPLTTVFVNNFLNAQTYILDWGTSFSPAWADGSTSGTATSIGGSGVNCNVNMVITGTGVHVSPAPIINNNNSNTAFPYFQVQNSTDAIKVSIDCADRTCYVDIILTFNSAISNVSFGISDIDKLSATPPYTYLDRVIVTGTGPSGVVVPVITKYLPGSDYFDISGNTATTQQSSLAISAASLTQGSPDQDATAFADFGSNLVTSINIRYGGLDDTDIQADPALQAIAIGNFSFQNPAPLPLFLKNFTGERNESDIIINWKTENEINAAHFAVEYSTDGFNFINGGLVAAKNLAVNNYQHTLYYFTQPLYYIRLKMTDIDGKFKYSAVVRILLNNRLKKTLNISPNPVSEIINIRINSDAATMGEIRIVDALGQILYKKNEMLVKGENVFSLNRLQNISKGVYTLQVVMDEETLSAKFISIQ
jgi:hypothetical protein